MEDKIVIYCDENETIALDGALMFLIEKACSRSPTFKLQEDDMNFVIDICFNALLYQGINPKKPIVSSTIPLIQFTRHEKLLPPFNDLSWILSLLTEKSEIHSKESREELEEQVNKRLMEDFFYLHIFPWPIRNISGFIYAELKDKTVLLPFAHDSIFLL